jgi:hypothetical protein
VACWYRLEAWACSKAVSRPRKIKSESIALTILAKVRTEK